MAARDILQAASGATGKLYVDDVFSTYLYDGNGTTQTINNGIDLAGKGGMVWLKQRSGTNSHAIIDTARGTTNVLQTNTTVAQFTTSPQILTSFDASGYTLGGNTSTNASGQIYTSWTFRKAPKFFDVVTYTGNGTTQDIAHSLGVAPGMVIVKSLGIADWFVWHRGTTSGNYLLLNSTSAQSSFNAVTKFGNNTATVDPTSSVFTVGSDSGLNANTQTYVAYLFAHDTSTDGIIQCGSFTTDVSALATVSLGWEPQFVLFKASGATQGWYLCDSLRNMGTSGTGAWLVPNTTAVEVSGAGPVEPNATGFGFKGTGFSNTPYVYLAIRIPNKPPTSGTEVFQPVIYTANNVDNRLITTGIKTDMVIARRRDDVANTGHLIGDRLRGQPYLGTAVIGTEVTAADAFDQQIVSATEYGTAFSSMVGFFVGNNLTAGLNYTTLLQSALAFKRAPGFFDVVCYTGTGANRTVSHNLNAAPELLITKKRDGTSAWSVWHSSLPATNYLTFASTTGGTDATMWNSTAPTSSVFSLGTAGVTNVLNGTFVAYLFATLPGISKVGSYTGNGSSQTINCGFSTGARFILIKRTDSTGDWYVWDSARGIVTATDPHLSLNTTAAEVTTDDSVDPDNSGFIVNQLAATNINVTSATYIFLAVA